MTPASSKERLKTLLKRVGQRVRATRQARQLSIEAASLEAEMTSGHWGKIERNQGVPSIEALCRVAEVLHTSLAELVGDEPLTDDHLIQEIADLVGARPADERGTILAIFRQIAHLGRKPERRTRKPRRG